MIRRVVLAALVLWTAPVVPGGTGGDASLGLLAVAPTMAQVRSLPAAGGSASDRAIARWTERVDRHAADHDAWTSLGEAFVQKARETADATYYRRAEAAFQKALALQARHVGALTGMAWVYSALHEFEESVVWAKKALAVDATHAPAHGLLGDAAVEMGDYDEAFDHYQKMLDARPDLTSYSRGAHLLYLTGNHRKAVWMMEKAAAAGAAYAENTAWARAQLALLLWSNGSLLPAEQVLAAALRAMPGNHHVLAAMGKVKASRRDWEGAIDSYKRSIAIAPLPEAIVALGDLYLATGRKDEAEKQDALMEAIQRLNRAAGVRADLQLARFYADRDRNLALALQEAEAVYQTRRNVYAADTLAWCYYKVGRPEDARRMIARALSRGTPDALILYHAGMIHAKLGDRPAAQRLLYQALSLNPQFHPLHAARAVDALKELGGRPPSP